MNDEKDLSAETSEAAKAVQDVDKALGSPLSLLLGPTFKLIGEHWGKKTDAYLNPKQIENLEDKIAIAHASGPLLLGNETKPRQIAALMEWTDAAHDVDGAANPELSQAWAQALRDISEQNYTLLDSLSKLDEEDVTLLKSGGVLSKEQFLKYRRIGLIDGPRSTSLLGQIAGLLSVFIVSLGFLGFGALVGVRVLESVFGWQLLSGAEPLGWSILLAIPIVIFCLALPASSLPELHREFVAKTNTASMSVLGRDIISKLGCDTSPEFTYSKLFLPREKRRSPLFD